MLDETAYIPAQFSSSKLFAEMPEMSTDQNFAPPQQSTHHPYLPHVSAAARLREADEIASFEGIFALEDPRHRFDVKRYTLRTPLRAVPIKRDYNLGGILICAGDMLVEGKNAAGDETWTHVYRESFNENYVGAGAEFTPTETSEAGSVNGHLLRQISDLNEQLRTNREMLETYAKTICSYQEKCRALMDAEHEARKDAVENAQIALQLLDALEARGISVIMVKV